MKPKNYYKNATTTILRGEMGVSPKYSGFTKTGKAVAKCIQRKLAKKLSTVDEADLRINRFRNVLSAARGLAGKGRIGAQHLRAVTGAFASGC